MHLVSLRKSGVTRADPRDSGGEAFHPWQLAGFTRVERPDVCAAVSAPGKAAVVAGGFT
jgi:hypothetical protein